MMIKAVKLGNDPRWHRIVFLAPDRTECGERLTKGPAAVGGDDMVDCPECVARAQSGKSIEPVDPWPQPTAITPAGFRAQQGRTAGQVEKEGQIGLIIGILIALAVAMIGAGLLMGWLKEVLL